MAKQHDVTSEETILMFASHLTYFCCIFSAVGDTVAEDEVVLEIETDKVGFYLSLSCLFICLCLNDTINSDCTSLNGRMISE